MQRKSGRFNVIFTIYIFYQKLDKISQIDLGQTLFIKCFTGPSILFDENEMKIKFIIVIFVFPPKEILFSLGSLIL